MQESTPSLLPPASPDLPLYQQVKESLRSRIADGTYALHQQLPAESQISSMFGVSRITVRQALGDLQNEGLIVKVAGKGSFVAKPKATQELSELEGFAESMSRKGYEVFNRVVSHRSLPAPADAAQRLQVDAGAAITEIRRIRHLNRAPVSLEVTYVSQDIGERLRHADLERRDIFLILENDFGITLGRADLHIDAIAADAELARALEVAPGTALLRIERLTHDAAGAPLDFEYLFFRGDSFQYRLQIERRAGAAHAG